MYLFIHLFMHVSIYMYLYIAAFLPYRLSLWARAARVRHLCISSLCIH